MTLSESQRSEHAARLVQTGRRFYSRGWLPGTGGNLSSVISREPLQIAVTPSSVHKGELTPDQILVVDESGECVTGSSGRPSAEVLLHTAIAQARGAGSVLHTHSVWGTILSDVNAARGGLEIEGYELLKALSGVTTHEHREWIPILENDQDMHRLAARVRTVLEQSPGAHALLLRRHGLYTWGSTLTEAERHVEVLEFLFETVGRSAMLRTTEASYGSFENP